METNYVNQNGFTRIIKNIPIQFKAPTIKALSLYQLRVHRALYLYQTSDHKGRGKADGIPNLAFEPYWKVESKILKEIDDHETETGTSYENLIDLYPDWMIKDHSREPAHSKKDNFCPMCTVVNYLKRKKFIPVQTENVSKA